MLSDFTGTSQCGNNQMSTKLNATRAMISRTQECFTPAARADSPIWPATRPEKRAWIRQAWYRSRPNVATGMDPRPDYAPVEGIPFIEILARTGRNWVVRTATTKRKTKNER
jgi:hypothetical protein